MVGRKSVNGDQDNKILGGLKMTHSFLGQTFFCSGHPCRHKIVNCVPGAAPIPPVSCTGAAVSCLKLAVEFWTRQSFVS